MNSSRLVLLTIGVLTRDFGAENVTEEHIFPLIPTAVKQLQNKLIQSNPAKLENFRTEFSVTAADGIADLSAVSEAGLRLDLITRANIKVSYGENPTLQKVQMVSSFDRFTSPGIQDRFYVLGYLEGSQLHLRDGSDTSDDPTTSFAGDLVIRGIYCPQTVDDLSSELEGELVVVLVELAKLAEKERRVNRDIAERKA
jgi:hypothetical protein